MEINTIQNTLEILHNDAKKDILRVGKGIVKSVFRPMQPSDFKDAYLPISKEQGAAIRQLIVGNNCKQIVEFGTSFGISTIYLADAAKQTNGFVTSTEIIEEKAQRAQQNINDAGVENYVSILVGDAMNTLKEYSKPIDFLFLDGWKDLYLPLFNLLEPLFQQGTLIYADNMDMSGTKDFAQYVLNQTKYATKVVHNGKAFLSTKK